MLGRLVLLLHEGGQRTHHRCVLSAQDPVGCLQASPVVGEPGQVLLHG